MLPRKEYLPRQDLLRSLLSIEFSVLPIQLGYHDVVNFLQLVGRHTTLEVQSLRNGAINLVHLYPGWAFMRCENVTRVVKHTFQHFLLFLNLYYLFLLVCICLCELDPRCFNQITELVVNVLIRVEIKRLQQLDVLYLVEPNHWLLLRLMLLTFGIVSKWN